MIKSKESFTDVFFLFVSGSGNTSMKINVLNKMIFNLSKQFVFNNSFVNVCF